MDVGRAQAELRVVLQGGGPREVHVTELAAACLRAVDHRKLARLLDAPASWPRFAAVRVALERVIETAGRRSTLDGDTCHELGRVAGIHAAVTADDVSFAARALAQALHQTCRFLFWSYFSTWDGPRTLSPGDPFPVPMATRIDQVYPAPEFRLSPSPDSRDAPQDLPGGYRGLPSLRLVPELDGEIVLDPSLGKDFCPLSEGAAAGRAAIVVPAEYLLQGYTLEDDVTDSGDAIFYDVKPRSVTTLVTDVMANLERAAGVAALAVMPELTSAPPLELEIESAMAGGKLGHLQLVVAGSAWLPLDGTQFGRNRSCAFPRDREPHSHDKFSHYRDKAIGREAIAHRTKRITILAGPRCTYTMLICKDALESWVPAALHQLRVRLVVLVSCNAGIGAFDPAARSISDLGWSTVVVANLPARATDPREEYARAYRPAAVAKPRRPGEVTVVAPDLDGYNQLLLLNIKRTD